MKAPFPYFGGKSRIAAAVWRRLGNVPNYAEPFAGSLAVLLARPYPPETRGVETVNDLDGLLANFWRAIQAAPDEVAQHADWPIHECDLHARHLWLIGQRKRISGRLMADPAWYDAQAAGWWVWGICSWIGSGWCSGDGPWSSEAFAAEDGGALPLPVDDGLGNAGRGIHRQLPHLGNAGQGIHRQRPRLGDAGREGEDDGECAVWSAHLRDTMRALADRLRRVRVCCGDWTRILGETPTTKQGLTAVFLDPPYSLAERTDELYVGDGAHNDCAAAVREWAIAHGDDPLLRIALCGYDGEHDMPASWETMPWKAHGGYGSQGEGRGRENAAREVVYFSPHCLKVDRQPSLFDALEAGEG